MSASSLVTGCELPAEGPEVGAEPGLIQSLVMARALAVVAPSPAVP